MDSMKEFSENISEQDLDELGKGNQDGSTQDLDQKNTGQGFFSKITDVVLQDTGHKPLESYNPEDYNLPDTKGSKRVIRATDVLLKNNLETIITDYLFGAYDLLKNFRNPAQTGIEEVEG